MGSYSYVNNNVEDHLNIIYIMPYLILPLKNPALLL